MAYLGEKSLARKLISNSLGSQKANIAGTLDCVPDQLLVSSPNEGGLLHLWQAEMNLIENRCTTGLFRHGDKLYRSLQHPDHLEIAIDDLHAESRTIVNLELCDIHDIRLCDDLLVAVSTSTNEVVWLNENGQIERRIKLPGEGDAWHVNCLDVWYGKLVASAFGQFSAPREWKTAWPDMGIVFEVESRIVLWSGLNQPHSPRQDLVGNRYVCDSAGQRLLIDRRGHGESLSFANEYPRGLAFGKAHIYVGLSRSRNVVDVGQGRVGATIVVLDRFTLQEKARLQMPFAEIYDIICL